MTRWLTDSFWRGLGFGLAVTIGGGLAHERQYWSAALMAFLAVHELRHEYIETQRKKGSK